MTLPWIYGIPEHEEARGLMADTANRLAIFRRAATSVDKILKVAKPGDVPIEQPTKFELVNQPQDGQSSAAHYPAVTPTAR